MTINLSALQKQRRDTAANWTAENPTLLAGEIGIESDTGYWKVGDGATAWTSLAYVSGLGGKVGLPDGTAAAPALFFADDTNTGIYSPGADQLALSTNGTGRLFVDESGNVATGAGTFTKAFTINNANAAIALRAGSVGPYTDQGIHFYVDGTAYSQIYNQGVGQLVFRTGSGLSERLRITSTGLVGIGTSSPSATLYVNNSSLNAPSLTYGATAGQTFQNQLSELAFGANSSSPYSHWIQARFSTSAAQPLALNPLGGNVGIGTTSPGAELEISSADNTTDIFISEGTSPSVSRIRNVGGTLRIDADLNNSGAFASAIILGVDNSERARIDSSGRLLIGTSSVVGSSSGVIGALQHQSSNTGTLANANFGRWTNDTSGYALYFAKSRGTSVGTQGLVSDGDFLGALFFEGSDGTQLRRGAAITANVDGTPGANDMPGRLVFSVTADGASSPTEALRISNNRAITVSDGGNVVLGTTTGTKIGTATTQKLGFYNATPVVQPAAVADATDAATVITQLNDLLAKLRTLGIIAT